MVQVEKDIMNKLVFCKYLVERGNYEVLKPEPLSSIALLNYHDALEFLFLIIGYTSGKIKVSDLHKLTFIDIYYEIDEIYKFSNLNPDFKTDLDKIKQLRANIKHKGIIISKSELSECSRSCKKIFETLIQIVFDLSLQDISLINLINSPIIRQHLSNAEYSFLEKDYGVCINLINAAFLELLHECDTEKYNTLPEYNFYSFGREPSGTTATTLVRENTRFDEKIEFILHNLKILTYGFDYKKYAKFKRLISNQLDNDIDFNFCVDYVIECTLILQNFEN